MSGFKSELLSMMTGVLTNLKARGSIWGKECRKPWEQRVRDAESAAALSPLLLELEAALRSVQEEEDGHDDTEVQKLREQEMTGSWGRGWWGAGLADSSLISAAVTEP